MKSHAFLITFIGLILLTACSPSDETSVSQGDTESQSTTADVELVSEEDQNSSPKPSGASEDSITSPLEITNAGQVFDPNLAQQLNSLGFDYYQEKEYALAAENFAKAMAYDDTNPLPVFNLACTLALMDSPETPANPEEIVRHLFTTLQIDPGRLDKVKTDSDLESIRDSAQYKALVNFYDLDYSGAFLQAFQPQDFGFFSWFMHTKNTTVLWRPMEEHQLFVPSHMISMLDLSNGGFALVYPVYTSREANLDAFEQMEGESQEMFGYVGGTEACDVHIAYFDGQGRLKGEGEVGGFNSYNYAPFSNVKTIGGYSTALSFEYSFFVSGGVTFLYVADINYGRVSISEPIVVNAEDLSGGEAPQTHYKNLRAVGRQILIDKYRDGILESVVTLIE